MLQLTSHKRLSLTVSVCCAVLIPVLIRFVPAVSSRSATLEHDLNQRFLEHEVLQLDAATVSQQVRDTGRLSLASSDLNFDLELAPHDLRAPDYRAEVFGADSVGHAIDVGPVRTFKGRARGSEGGSQLPQLGEARFTIDETNIEGLIITPTAHYYVEPARNFSKAATKSEYVVYKESDVVTNSTGECGMTLSEQVNQKSQTLTSSTTKRDSFQAAAAAGLQELRIATEADNEYVLATFGPEKTGGKILSILNQVEGIYEFDLGLTFRVVYQSFWNTPDDPFSATSPSESLGELANYWNSNRGSVARDVVHMWTGKQLDNQTLGTAYLEALCRFTGNGRAAYGLSKFIADDSQQVAVTAHEIGHNLGATHPNQQVPPVTDCADTVMNSTITAGTRLSFCQYSGDEVARYLSTNADCLAAGRTHLNFAIANETAVGGLGPRAVARGDFNADGKGDVVVANTDSDNISVLLGTDAGGFQLFGNYPTGHGPNSITSTSFFPEKQIFFDLDFNGDGKQDVAVTVADGVEVLLGIGDGGFQPATHHAAGLNPASIAVADFNQDGKLDVVVVNSGGSTVSVLFGGNGGTFQSPTSFPAGDNAMALVLANFNPAGDFDPNARTDIAVLNVAGSLGNKIHVLMGQAGGSFQAPNERNIFNLVPNSIVAGDFDGDHKADLAVAGTDPFALIPGKIVVFRGQGDGSFDFNPSSSLAGSRMASPLSLTVGDFNNDGKDDLAMSLEETSSSNQSISILLAGSGNGLFEPVTLYRAGFLPASIAEDDYNGDGKNDLAVVNNGSNDVSLLLGSGTGSFQAVLSLPTDVNPSSVALGKFNGDGALDIAVTNFSGTVATWLGTGTGNFDFSTNKPVGLGPTGVTVADFNNDNRGDLAVAVIGLSILLADSNGVMQAPVTFSPGDSVTSVAAADFNRDGKLDVATNSLILPGKGDGTFQPAITHPSFGAGVTAGDLNGDANPDLVLPGSGNSEVGILLGNGNGSFQPIVNYQVGPSPQSAAIADFNSDNKPDVVVANNGNSTVSILLGTGTGTFQPATSFPAGSGAISVAVADFDRDNNQDLAVANYLTPQGPANETVSILLGTGLGTFRPPINLHVGLAPISVAAGDFNFDTKPDLAVANNGGNVSVVLNISGQQLAEPTNDNFDKARVISGASGTLPGSTVLATKEFGEPSHASESSGTGGSSIWYRWIAPSSGRFYFDTFSSSFPSVVAIYRGDSLNSLVPVVKSTSSVPEYVEFDASGNFTYYIAIDGVTGDTGRTVLTWNTGSLSNDNLAFAREIRGSSGSVNGNNTNFTLEPNEPPLPGPSAADFSAWYRWTAPNTGKVSFLAEPPTGTPCGDTTRLLGAYTGAFMDVLSQVSVNFDGYRDFDDPGICDNRSLRFNAVAGTTYRIQLRSVSGKPFKLSWNYANPPPNDNFANALILAGNSGSLIGTNRDATKEPGEPNHAGGPGGASIWYRWTAPTSGQVTFDAIGFRNQTSNSFRYLTALMAVYTGANLNSLTSVVTNSIDNKVTFNATAGTTYHIAIDSAPYAGGGYLPGLVPLHWGAKQVANDDFANAQQLSAASAFVPLLGSNGGATKEAGEPNHQGNSGGASVWYRWTALSSELVSFVFNQCSTCTLSQSNALVAVYTGTSVNALTPVPTTIDNNHSFSAVRGITYFVAVDSNTGSGGTYEFSLVSSSLSARNDNFNQAQALSGANGSVAGDNSGATRETGEPNHATDRGGASVWYQWRAPASGLVTFDTFGSNFDTLLAVYTGNAVNALSVVASSDNAGSSAQSRVTFDAKANTTYQIAIDGKSTSLDQGTGLPRGETGLILLNWSNLPPPVNDNFANAQTISGASGNVTGRNTVASKEGGEPNHAGGPGGASVWYRWTAPSTGNLTFTTVGSDFNTLLAVYTGSTINALTLVSDNDDVGGLVQSRVTFNATAGTVYYIAIDGSVGVPGNLTQFSGNVVLSWFSETGNNNDNFLAAQELNGTNGSLAATNASATKENGEPNHANDRGGRSVWYSWTAPFTGPVLFTTVGSDFDTVLAVYTGTNVTSLTPIANNNDSPYSDNLSHILTSSLTFTATAGTTYKIAVDGSGGRFGSFALRWGPDATISGQVLFVGGLCGSDKKVTMVLSGEDARAVTFTGSGIYSFEHLRVGGNYSVRGVSEVSVSCSPLFLERALNLFPLASDVLNANFTDDGLRGGGSTSNISGHVTRAGGLGLENVEVTLSGTASKTAITGSSGGYQLPNLPDGNYRVTPSKAGYVFTPSHRDFTFTFGQSPTGEDFEALPTFNIGGQTRAANGSAIAGVTVTLHIGTQSVSVPTNADGYYSFDATAGGNYTLTADKAGLSFTPSAHDITGLNDNQHNVDFTVSQTPAQIELLLEEQSTTMQAAALDAALLMRDPFPVVNPANLFPTSDHNTRVLLFVRNLQLAAGDTAAVIQVHMMDANGQSFDVPAENFFSLPGFDFSQLTFRLPDTLAPGTCTIEIRAHGQTSNTGTILIRL